MNREAWLMAVGRKLKPWWRRAGYEIPAFHASCGWPSAAGTSVRLRAVAECWNGATVKDGIPQIFISPAEDDSVDVAGHLAHELLHATLSELEKTGDVPHNASMHHGNPFVVVMKELGFKGKPIKAHPGPELRAELERIVAAIGPYPHSAIKFS